MLGARALVVLPLAALLAFGAIRAMTFVAPPAHPLRAAAPLFASHPDSLVDFGMTQIGQAAAKGGSVPPPAREAMTRVARSSPLSPEPFLVEGTIAEMAGDQSRAERLFLAARGRDPRSQGARYFLANRYLQTNRVLPGLVEISALARLSEQASKPLVPALAAYARTPGAVAQLRRFFELSPAVGESTLALLAEDARNAPLVLALAPDPRPGAPLAAWQGRLIQSLIANGDYAGAEKMWRRAAGVSDRGLVYNPQFRASSAPPPFNWQFTSGKAGVAEPIASGGLDVIYYGREEVTLASQLLRLAPGRYRLAQRVDGTSQWSGLAWNVLCVGSDRPLLRLPLGAEGRALVAGAFAVPTAACPAQMLELRGRPDERTQTAQLKLTDLALVPLAGAR